MLRLNRGFTLMEIMVTMAILATIAAIAIPSYSGYMHNSYLTECSNEVAAIKLAEQEYFLENNAYFPNPAGTSPNIQQIEIDSNGMYVSGYYSANAVTWANNLANANCTYRLTSTAPPGATYTIFVSGKNNLKSPDDDFQFTK